MLTATAALERRASGCPRPLALKPWNLTTRKPPKGREPLSGERDLGLPHGPDDPPGRPAEVPGPPPPRRRHAPRPPPARPRPPPRRPRPRAPPRPRRPSRPP